MAIFPSTFILTAAAGIAMGIASASAAPVSPAPIGIENPNIVKVARWNQERDGRRCLSRDDRCRNFYRGYYYETPWWTAPLIIGGGLAARHAYEDDSSYDDDSSYEDDSYGDDHVQWCIDRYRSYDPRTNTWVSHGGRVEQCFSPFS